MSSYRQQKALQQKVQLQLITEQQIHEESQKLLIQQQMQLMRENRKRNSVGGGRGLLQERTQRKEEKLLNGDCVRSLTCIDSEYAKGSITEVCAFIFCCV